MGYLSIFSLICGFHCITTFLPVIMNEQSQESVPINERIEGMIRSAFDAEWYYCLRRPHRQSYTMTIQPKNIIIS